MLGVSKERFKHEDIRRVPRGYKVRTKKLPGGKEIRLAFPPGPRQRGAGVPVSVLTPKSHNPKKVRTLDQIKKMQQKAVDFLRNVVGDDDKADEIESLSAAEYAAHKHVTISNPCRNRKAPKARVRVTMTGKDVQRFNKRSRNPGLIPEEFSFDFDPETGDLIEIAAPEGSDADALDALAEEAFLEALRAGALENPRKRRAAGRH